MAAASIPRRTTGRSLTELVGRVGCAAALVLVLAAALLTISAAPGAPTPLAADLAGAASQRDPQTAPLVLRQGIGLYDQFGYSPAYVRNVPSFDSNDRPYIRSRGADLHRTGFVQDLFTVPYSPSYWQSFSFLAALRRVYPTYSSIYYGAGWWCDRIIFDTSDRAYTIVSVQMPNQKIKNAMLFSTDLGHTWQGVQLPDGEIAAEYFTGHNQITGPPFLGIYIKNGYIQSRQANKFALYVTQPYWQGSSIVVPGAVGVSDNTFGWSQHSGGASFAASHYSGAAGRMLTHFVYGELTGSKKAGSPIFAATYDPATGQIAANVELGRATPANDVHCTPGITVDGAGYLHVIFGSHQQPFKYTCSAYPDAIGGGWSAPADVLTSGYITNPAQDPDGAGKQTYIALVCGPDNSLHLAFRQYRKGVDPYFGGKGYMSLSYMRKDPGPAGQPWLGAWTTPQVLAVPAAAGYSIWFQKLAIDHDGRLYVSANNLTGADKERLRGQVRKWRLRGKKGPRPGYYLRRFVLTSTDNGASWHLASIADFETGVGLAGVATRAVKTAAAEAKPTTVAAEATTAEAKAVTGEKATFAFPAGTGTPAVAAGTAAVAAGTEAVAAGTEAVAAGAASSAATSVTAAKSTTPALSTGTAGWMWRNRLPQGNTLGGVDFSDIKHGVAVGDEGTILRTKDGGASWQAKVTGSRATLFAVDLVGKKDGWAVGDIDAKTGRSTILHTSNSGGAWSKQTAPSTVPLFGCAFADPKHGFAVGDSGLIIGTKNGGKSWKVQITHTTNTLYGVTTIDAAHAWAVGENGVVLQTIDAGRHWEVLRPKGFVPPEESRHRNMAKPGTLSVADKYATGRSTRSFDFGELYSVSFKSRTLGWAVGEAGGVFVSRNSGRTWTRQKVTTSKELTAVRFVTLKVGWITGLDGTLMYTTDQGRRWKKLSAPALSLYGMTRLDATRGWAVGASGQILQLGAVKKAAKKSATGVSADLSSGSLSGSTGLVVGAGGTVLRTANAGASWQWQKPAVTSDLRSVHMSSATHAVAVGDGGTILTSANGGSSWTKRPCPVGGELRSVDTRASGIGWAVGAAGTVLRTADGGATWQLQGSGVGQDLSAVASVSDTEVWAGGGDVWGDLDAVLLHTDDAGATWRPVRLAGPSGSTVRGEVGAICAASPQQVWAAGSDWAPDDDTPTGFVARSTDGGATWQVVYLPGTSRIRALSCPAPGVVWAAGDDGATWRSADGGVSWTDVRSGAGQHLRSVVFTDALHGWLFGAGGAMLSTETGGLRR